MTSHAPYCSVFPVQLGSPELSVSSSIELLVTYLSVQRVGEGDLAGGRVDGQVLRRGYGEGDAVPVVVDGAQRPHHRSCARDKQIML